MVKINVALILIVLVAGTMAKPTFFFHKHHEPVTIIEKEYIPVFKHLPLFTKKIVVPHESQHPWKWLPYIG